MSIVSGQDRTKRNKQKPENKIKKYLKFLCCQDELRHILGLELGFVSVNRLQHCAKDLRSNIGDFYDGTELRAKDEMYTSNKKSIYLLH